MQVTNTSDQSTRYTVTSGSTVPPITPPPGTTLRGILQPGEQHEVNPRGNGPWKVMFMPEGGEMVATTVRNRCDVVSLKQEAEGFGCEVMASAA